MGDVLKVGNTELHVLSLAQEDAPAAKPAIYNAHVHTPDDEPHPGPVSKDLGESTDEDVNEEHLWDDYEDEREGDTGLHSLKEVAEKAAAIPTRGASPPEIFVERISHKLEREFEDKYGMDVRKDPQAWSRLQEGARKAVIELEHVKSTTVDLPFLMADSSGPKHLQLQVHRRHLHEEIDHIDPSYQSGAEQNLRELEAFNKKAKAVRQRAALGVGIGMSVFIAVTVIFSGGFFESSGPDNPGATPSTTAQSPEEARALNKIAEAELKGKVLSLLKAEDRSPQKLMDQLDEYELEAKQAGYDVGWDYERTRTYLSTKVYRDVSERYGDVSGDQYDLRQSANFREAQRQVDELQVYLKASPHNQRAIDVLDLDDLTQRWTETNQSGSEKLIAEQLLLSAEAIELADYQSAAAALKGVVDGAIIEPEVLKKCQALYDEWKQRTDEPRLPFNHRTDAPPSAPENALLPAGDRTAYSRLNSLERRVKEAIKDGSWDGREFELWGLTGVVNARPKSSQLVVTYRRDLGDDVVLTGTHTVQLSNMPPQARLNVLMLDENLIVEDLTACLVYAFDRGLSESVGQIAFKLREAGPEWRAQLDEILAAKWEVPIPEGGFPERDGSVVPE
ncbi:MAG: Hsp70 family protein [Planctomycetes bacterium]|nr:Hsp70 family protein [Planctomycetota bacterium]